MKSQALIVQFIIFFTIGLSFFLLTGNLFRLQSDVINGDILDYGSKLAVTQASAVAIDTVDTCKTCDNASLKTMIKPIAGFDSFLNLNKGMNLYVEAQNKIANSTMHNLYYSINYTTGQVASTQPITLTYIKTNNTLVMR